jgi:hypothetical protein
MRQGILRLLLVLAPTCLSWGCRGCSSKDAISPSRTQVALGKVSVRSTAKLVYRGREVHLDEQVLTDKVRAQIATSGIFSTAGEGKFTAEVSIVAEPVADTSSAQARDIGVKARLRVSIRPERGAEPRFAEDTAGMGQTQLLEGGDIDEGAIFERLAERTTSDLVRAYLRRQKLWESDVPSLRAALADSDTETRLEAIRIVGAREIHALAGPIVQLLSDEDEDIRDTALGALVAMREPGVVKALADSHQMRDAREVRKVIDAIATLGGREAEEYLGFVAETHDDEEVRDMAKNALERLRSRTGRQKPTK